MERLDKIISNSGYASRKECGKIAREGRITVNGQTVRMLDTKVDEKAVIAIDGQPIERHHTVICIMNKPSGYVTSTDDPTSPTVMELLPEKMLRQKVVPAGRLDKDTEGLLVFTNDGDLLHRLISPKSEVTKEYYIEYEGTLKPDAPEMAQSGVVLRDGTVCKNADLKMLEEGRCTLTIREGMYHQVKRMVAALGAHVTYLRRIRIGSLELGDLPNGEVRELSEREIESLFG
ncbi:MAG: rRNA pseudouridine synthase [Spirochaetales bacterium]|nr:rRNA pseudouridine synthase [Spirochaetales bacterium]